MAAPSGLILSRGCPASNTPNWGSLRWLEGRPDRFSGIEVVGWNLERKTIAQTVLDGCLSDGAIAQYQEQYKALMARETDQEESVLT